MNSLSGNFKIPVHFRRGALKGDQEKGVESGRFLISLMCERLKLADLADCNLLDIGCGTRFTQAFLDDDIPIRKYVGIDVYKEMIDFLKQNVTDPKFNYHHVNIHNEMYNPYGVKLTKSTSLPIGHQKFDVISMFSVFTHLAPHDYRNMLHVARPYVKKNGKLIFSLFIDEVTQTGFGLIDGIVRATGEKWDSTGRDFQDLNPARPLYWALYSVKHARELIDGTGWRVIALHPPGEHIQHHFVCDPI